MVWTNTRARHATPINLALALVITSGAAPLAAAPLGYKNSTTLKLDYSVPWSTADLNHALSTRDGVGLDLNWIETETDTANNASNGGHHGVSGTGGRSSSGSELWTVLTYTRLLKRWNGEHSQSNLWLDLGAGMARSLGNTTPELQRGALAAGVSVDTETQRLYLAAAAKTLQAIGVARNQASIKAGVALSPADFERVQPWLMVEVRGMQGTTESLDVIPSLRLLHQSIVVELGASLQGHPHISLRYLF